MLALRPSDLCGCTGPAYRGDPHKWFNNSAVTILEIFKISQQEAQDFHFSLGWVNEVFCAPTFLCKGCSSSLLHNSIFSPSPHLFPHRPHCQSLLLVPELTLDVDVVCVINPPSEIQLLVEFGTIEWIQLVFLFNNILGTCVYTSKYDCPVPFLYQ